MVWHGISMSISLIIGNGISIQEGIRNLPDTTFTGVMGFDLAG